MVSVIKRFKKAISYFLIAILTIGGVTFSGAGNVASVDASTYYQGTLRYDYAETVYNLVNSERAKVGKSKLVLDEQLTEVAMLRAAEIAYDFDHTRPNGESCFSALDGIEWYAVGENIAYGYTNSDWVMNGWMNSTGHRDNILDADNYGFNSVGVGCFYYNGTYYWAQTFANKTTIPYEKRNNGTKSVFISTSSTGQQSYILGGTADLKKVSVVYASGPDGSVMDKTIPSGLGVAYNSHVQSYGWTQGYVFNGTSSGTSGQAKRMEAIRIKLVNTGSLNLGVTYRTHVQSYGWQGWKSDNALSGTSGEAKRLEAIEIKLTGSDASKYDIYYRVHAQSYGWLGWAKNGEPAGTSGQAKRLESIQIRILPKGSSIGDLTTYSFVDYGLTPSTTANGLVMYNTHVQSYGWENLVCDGSISGSAGLAKRLEGITIKINTSKLGKTGGIRYKTHVQTYGWQDWKSDGAMSGTTGEAKRLEAIQIELTGDVANYYDVYYRVHAQTYGWLGWAKNGKQAGTAGLAKRLEAIQIVVVPKGQTIEQFSSGGTAFVQ